MLLDCYNRLLFLYDGGYFIFTDTMCFVSYYYITYAPSKNPTRHCGLTQLHGTFRFRDDQEAAINLTNTPVMMPLVNLACDKLTQAVS